LTVARFLAATAAALASGCAQLAPAPVVVPIESQPLEISMPSDLQRAHERRRALALKHERNGDLVNASRQWQVVLLLEPGDEDARRRLTDLQNVIERSAAEEWTAAREALRRSETDKAQQSLLRVLALDANHDEAIAALREIERQRSVRRAADRAARARLDPLAALKRNAMRSPPGEAGDYDTEQSLELLRAGDATVALAELQRQVASNPRDRFARERIAGAVRSHAQQLEQQGDRIGAIAFYAEAIRLHGAAPKDWVVQLSRMRSRLAGEEYEKGVRVIGRDPNAAIAHFENALRASPDHTQAQLQLERARRMQKNLSEIPARPR
jgi:tetratricopeptide (TPR) repeat protein